MDDEEEHQQHHDGEMDGARGLASPDDVERQGQAAFMPGDMVRPVRMISGKRMTRTTK